MSSAVCSSSMYSLICMKMSYFLFVRAWAMPVLGVPKKSIPKIKVFYKKSWSGIKSKPYCLNYLEGLDLIL